MIVSFPLQVFVVSLFKEFGQLHLNHQHVGLAFDSHALILALFNVSEFSSDKSPVSSVTDTLFSISLAGSSLFVDLYKEPVFLISIRFIFSLLF